LVSYHHINKPITVKQVYRLGGGLVQQ